MKWNTFLLIFCFLLNQNLSAQKSKISLGVCIERAQENSFLIYASKKKTTAAEKKIQFTRSLSLPQIDAQLSANHQRLEPYSFNQRLVLLTADWSLGEFLLNTAQLAIQDKLITQTNMQQQRLDVSLRCAMLYIYILQKQVGKESLQQRLNLLNKHYNVAQALWQSGTRTQFDLLQTESEISRFKEDIIFLELERQNFLQELAQLINEKDTDSIETQALDTERICNQQLPELFTETLTDIPVIKSFNLRIKAQQLLSRTVTAQQLPHLNMFGGFVLDEDPTGDGNYWQIGAGISLPIFRWNATSFQKQEYMAIAEELDFQKQETERNISIFTNQAQQKLAKLKDIIELQQKRLEITENAFKIAQANYQAGLMSNLEYLSSQQQFTETHIAVQETQLDYAGALVQFYIITNQLDKINEL